MTILINTYMFTKRHVHPPEGHPVHPHLPQLPLKVGSLHGATLVKLVDQADGIRVPLGYPQHTLFCVDHRKKLFGV